MRKSRRDDPSSRGLQPATCARPAHNLNTSAISNRLIVTPQVTARSRKPARAPAPAHQSRRCYSTRFFRLKSSPHPHQNQPHNPRTVPDPRAPLPTTRAAPAHVSNPHGSLPKSPGEKEYPRSATPQHALPCTLESLSHEAIFSVRPPVLIPTRRAIPNLLAPPANKSARSKSSC